MRKHDDITRTVKAHADTVLRVCTLYFHGRPERDDAFQETFLKYAQSDKPFADEEHVKAWLINVAANTCKDMLKRSEAKTIPLGEFEENARPSWNSGNDLERDPAIVVAGSESSRLDELTAALQQLDGKHRITLYLKYYEGYTAAEIAEMLDMPENTVYTNLARGRNELKEVLTHEKQS